MARLLHFVHREKPQEYVIIVDDDDMPWEEYQNPGFDLRAELQIVGNVSGMPTDRELWEH